ncbi:MAG: YlmC/YmxH family sporulation protein [Alkaliphilus sp.]
MIKASELSQKEIINVIDGKRIGIISDIEIDLSKGIITAIIVPENERFMGIFGKEYDYEISWDEIKKIGEDVILVETKASVELNQSRVEGQKNSILETTFIEKNKTF